MYTIFVKEGIIKPYKRQHFDLYKENPDDYFFIKQPLMRNDGEISYFIYGDLDEDNESYNYDDRDIFCDYDDAPSYLNFHLNNILIKYIKVRMYLGRQTSFIVMRKFYYDVCYMITDKYGHRKNCQSSFTYNDDPREENPLGHFLSIILKRVNLYLDKGYSVWDIDIPKLQSLYDSFKTYEEIESFDNNNMVSEDEVVNSIENLVVEHKECGPYYDKEIRNYVKIKTENECVMCVLEKCLGKNCLDSKDYYLYIDTLTEYGTGNYQIYKENIKNNYIENFKKRINQFYKSKTSINDDIIPILIQKRES